MMGQCEMCHFSRNQFTDYGSTMALLPRDDRDVWQFTILISNPRTSLSPVSVPQFLLCDDYVNCLVFRLGSMIRRSQFVESKSNKLPFRHEIRPFLVKDMRLPRESEASRCPYQARDNLS